METSHVTAIEVEAALIDACPNLTNSAGGFGEYGAMHAHEIIQKYSAYPTQLQHRTILINVNRSTLESSFTRRHVMLGGFALGRQSEPRSQPPYALASLLASSFRRIGFLLRLRIFLDRRPFRGELVSLARMPMKAPRGSTLTNAFQMSIENKLQRI